VLLGLPYAAFAASPHAAFTPDTEACPRCHTPHQAASAEDILRAEVVDLDKVEFCYTCHDGSLAANAKTGNSNGDFGGTSGHSVEALGEADPDADLTDVCSDCHDPHADSATWFRLPNATITVPPGVDRTVTGANNTWCFACHDDAQSWYTSTTTNPYPSLASPSRNATGYPTLGTFPGFTVYADSAKNAHAGIPAGSMDDWVVASREATRVAGDCLWCHSGHRGVSEYDGLVGKFGASTPAASDTVSGDYAAVCFRCHASTLATGITFGSAVTIADIKSSATAAVDDPALFNGHRVRTDGGDLDPGSPLPCYECHNPHGSTRDNKTLFSDVLGKNLDTSTDAGVRRFCFTCHTTFDTDSDTGRPYGWDSASGPSGAYVAVSAIAEVAGLSRSAPADGATGNRLRLWDIRSGHKKDDTENCLTVCHGDVHAPMGSPAGQTSCFESSCHSALHGMVDDTTSYHHVLNADDPDQAPGEDGTYPVFTDESQKMSCVSCHVDHTEWDGLGNAYNLRSSGTIANPTASNTDEGLCLSCHSYTLLFRIYRSTDGTTPTPLGQAANELYATAVMRVEDDFWVDSPHNYPAKTYLHDDSEFVGNCSKCHGTLEAGQYGEAEPFAFTVHFSPEQRLLNALGQDRSSLPAPQTAAVNEEDMCFRCHSNRSDGLGGQVKPVDGKDWYGTQVMSVANTAIYAQMKPATNTFGHKPAAYDEKHLISSIDEPQSYLGKLTSGVAVNKHVECADCHNHHIVGKSRHIYGTDNRVSDAVQGVRAAGFVYSMLAAGDLNDGSEDNYPATLNYHKDGTGAELDYKQMATYEYEICFKCHSSANSDAGGASALYAWGGDMKWDVWSGTVWTEGAKAGVPNWTNVAQDFNVGNNSRHPVFATLDGRYYATADATAMSTLPDYVGYDTYQRNTANLPSTLQISNGWSQGDTMVCSDCHGDSSAPIAMRLEGTEWVPNEPAVLAVPQGPHGSSVRFTLRGPNTDWPVRTDAGHEGELITLGMLAAGYQGCLCTNCHPAERFTGSASPNTAHSRGWTNHASAACVSCHILVPHGGKVSRLIGDADAGGMPARLAYQGDLANMGVRSFTKRVGTDYAVGDCRVTAAAKTTTGVACGGGGGKHSTTAAATGTANGTGYWENW
jgi:predicted CXXCH cytochrome family protein